LDTAAILSQIDLLITTDSALAHLSGGLGVPTWVILGKVPDWRWQLHGTTSPWYPTLRLYRQQHLRDWASVIAQIATDLRTWCDTTPIPAHAASDADSSRTAPASPELLIPVGPGELFDKITILELKARRIQSEEKRRVVQVELSRLNAIRDEVFPDLAPKVILSIRALHEVNGRLWDVEDALRRHEMQQDFGASFIHYARSVYELNDRRAALKNEINALLGSTLVEVKDYPNLASK